MIKQLNYFKTTSLVSLINLSPN